MNRDEIVAIANDVLDFLVNDKVMKRHICESGWMTPNEGYEIHPLSAHRCGITIQLKDGRRVNERILRGVIVRVTGKYANFIEWVRVGDYDGSCPRTMEIRWQDWFADEFRHTDIAEIVRVVA